MKPEQVQAQLTRVLSEAIGELRDPRVPLIVTVERIHVTPDYGLARVYVSAMGADMPALLDAGLPDDAPVIAVCEKGATWFTPTRAHLRNAGVDLRVDDALAKEWTPLLASRTYDPGVRARTDPRSPDRARTPTRPRPRRGT